MTRKRSLEARVHDALVYARGAGLTLDGLEALIPSEGHERLRIAVEKLLESRKAFVSMVVRDGEKVYRSTEMG